MIHRISRSRRAASIVEAAFVLPMLVLFIMGIFEYARFLFMLQVTENAAREGARYAVARTGDGTSLQDIKDFVKTKMLGRDIDLEGYTVNVWNVDPSTGTAISGTTWSDAPFGGAIMVQVTGTYHPIMPAFLKSTANITIKCSSMMNSEAN